MVVDIVTARGTGEPFQGTDNMLTYVTRTLDPTKFNLVGDVSYPASVGPANQGPNPCGPSEDSSIMIGLDNLAQLIRASVNPVGLLGYSLGAELVTRFMELKAAGRYPECEIAFSACVASPSRADGDSIDPDPVGSGINGPHGPLPDLPHFEAANPADQITSCPADSPLRSLADTVSAFGFAEMGGWTQDLAQRMLTHRFQPASFGWWRHPVRTWALYDTAAHGVLGYLSGKTHVFTYLQDGYCQRLADRINAL